MNWGVCIISAKRKDRLDILKSLLDTIAIEKIPFFWEPSVLYDPTTYKEYGLTDAQNEFLPRGQIGCAIAHKNAMTHSLEFAAAHNLQYMLILEDDVECIWDRPFTDVVSHVISLWQPDIDYINIGEDILSAPIKKLGHVHTITSPLNGMTLQNPTISGAIGALAIVYRIKSLPKIIDCVRVPSTHADLLLNKCVFANKLRMNTCSPVIFRESDKEALSLNQSDTVRYQSPYKVIRHICHTPICRFGQYNIYAPTLLYVLFLGIAGCFLFAKRPNLRYTSIVFVAFFGIAWFALVPAMASVHEPRHSQYESTHTLHIGAHCKQPDTATFSATPHFKYYCD